jgi:hypothetical protein
LSALRGGAGAGDPSVVGCPHVIRRDADVCLPSSGLSVDPCLWNGHGSLMRTRVQRQPLTADEWPGVVGEVYCRVLVPM